MARFERSGICPLVFIFRKRPCPEAPKIPLAERALDAETRASQWLADCNEAKEAGRKVKAEHWFLKAQFWLDLKPAVGPSRVPGSSKLGKETTMRLEELFKIAEKGGNSPERVSSDKREAFIYMDVTSSEYRKKAANVFRYSR